MKEIVRASIEDCSQIERFRLVTRLGNAILSNGGEVFRAEQAMEYAARALRLEAFNAYVIANGIFSNVVIDGRFLFQPYLPCAAGTYDSMPGGCLERFVEKDCGG